MSHPSVELLSSYLDDHLRESERLHVESHLDGCQECRERLNGMTHVVHHLAGLSRMAPPLQLGLEVRRRVSIEGRGDTLLQRLEEGVAQLSLQASIVSAFAVVVALSVIIYVVAAGVERHGPSAAAPRAIASEKAAEPGQQDAAVQAPEEKKDIGRAEAMASNALSDGVGGRQEAEQTPRRRADILESRPAAGRTFDRQGDLWIEQGVGATTPTIYLTNGSQLARQWWERYPELEELVDLGGSVRLRLDGEIVEIRFDTE